MGELQRCFETQMLRKIERNREKALKSLETAGLKLKEAEELAKKGFIDACVLYSYSCMFHAGRALLYQNGIQEKSHYCLNLYLQEHYGKTNQLDIELIHTMDIYRVQRHEVLYGFNPVVEKQNAELALKTAEKILRKIKKIITATSQA